MKEDLAGGALPNGDFGENVARGLFRNILTGMFDSVIYRLHWKKFKSKKEAM